MSGPHSLATQALAVASEVRSRTPRRLQPRLCLTSGTTWRRRELAGSPSWSQSPGRPRSPAGGPRRRRQAAAADDIPVFDRNKVSLDLPGSLFGPSVSLLIRTTKIIGDVLQNSAVRYQTFLRLFRPLFRGPFEIKGLDPPTTTTTARPTTAADDAAANEVRRR